MIFTFIDPISNLQICKQKMQNNLYCGLLFFLTSFVSSKYIFFKIWYNI